MSTPTRPPARMPIDVCPVCGDPVLTVETETTKIDVPPYSPESPQVVTSIAGPSVQIYGPCGHRVDL